MAIAATLKKNNEERRAIDQKITEECFARINSEYDLATTFFIVVASENWHPGVIGIVASRIVEKYCRPACVLNIENGIARGSARSIPNFHVQKALQACSGLLESFGGHEHAAGLSMRTENITALREALNRSAGDSLSPGDFVPAITTDARIHDTDDITWETVNWLKRFQPFGPRNRRPVFYAENLRCAGEPRIVGVNHLKFRAGSGTTALDAIAFKMGHRLLDLCEPGDRHTCAFTIEENEWNGSKTIQLNMRGIA